MASKKTDLERKWKKVFPDRVEEGWKNSVQGWYVKEATPGLYTLDVEHIPDNLVNKHNDPNSEENIAQRYRTDLCPHKCSFCFNEDSAIYGEEKSDLRDYIRKNRIMSLDDTFNVVDQAIDIAREEDHDFKSVKFLGPGELLLNPQLFEILKKYQERNVNIGIFTKGAILGDDSLARKYQGIGARKLTDRLAGFDNTSLIFSFQSFDYDLQDKIVTTKEADGSTRGLGNYSNIRERAIDNLFDSEFYHEGITDRVCMINAPILPENIDESFDIYKFFIERGTPVVMTPSMVSGKGCGQLERQSKITKKDVWDEQLIDLYAKIYDFNVRKGIQTEEEIEKEGISSYAGAAPCNQVSTGLYIRANGYVQMCPGRFDKETFFGDLEDRSLKEIWDSSPNKVRGIYNPHDLINNRCPAKDGRAFPEEFYEKVMGRYKQLQAKP